MSAPTLKTANMGFGHGKLILFGEHAVVYGTPAIAAGFNRGAYAKARRTASSISRLSLFDANSTPSTLRAKVVPSGQDLLSQAWRMILREFPELGGVEVEVKVNVPTGAGLGSSAAMAAAIGRALAHLTDGEPCSDDDARVDRAVGASEGVFHGHASGVDQAAALRGGLLRFQRHDTHTHVGHISNTAPIQLAIGYVQSSASTGDMVQGVAVRHKRHERPMNVLLDFIERIVDDAHEAIKGRQWQDLGELMDMNHGALVSMGVSTRELDEACHVARAAGAMGAKLTGSGGGGCVIALTPQGGDDVIQAWRTCGYEGFCIAVGN